MALMDNKITEILYLIDEFCIEFDKSVKDTFWGINPREPRK